MAAKNLVIHLFLQRIPAMSGGKKSPVYRRSMQLLGADAE